LHAGFNRLYELRFLISLLGSVRRKRRAYPAQYARPSWRCLRSIRDFDDEVTARCSGFTCADDYYARASASPLVPRISVPTLVIHAEDDPFVRLLPATRAALRANPHVELVLTARGGHCGFIAAPDGYDGRWAERRVIRFFGRF
jgi:predicted alpha/beta-fold hydrolase